jgi:hypothetical protein
VNDDKWYEKKGVTPPSHQPHLTLDDLTARLTPLKLHSWRQDGNKLIGQSEMGEVVNFLPTDVMLTGTDDKGLPVFKKV